MSLSLDNKTIYEIFRACRLCGAGGGYKMPIIPSVVGFDCADIDLRQKIRECVQIEVNQDDKMPPLICELCVDKVNDFYEFLAMCRDTNVKTRRRLGLPDIQTQNLSEADNCILGVTEPVYQRDEDDEPLKRRSVRSSKVKVKREDKDDKIKEKDRVKSLKKELENLIKQESSVRDSRSPRDNADPSARQGRRPLPPPPPARETRQAGDTALSRLKVIEIEDDEDSNLPLVQPGKRTRDRSKEDTPSKKVKITIKVPPPESPPPSKMKSRPGPKCSKRAESPAPKPKHSSPAPGPKSSKRTTSPIPFKKPSSPSPGPKSSKRTTSPITFKRPSSPSPGPKSSKRTTSPSPNPPTFKRPLSSPGPKSSKRTTSPSPNPPIPSRRTSSPSPGPKSKTLPNKPKIVPPIVPKPTKAGPKSSKRLSSPGPKSSKTPPAPVGKGKRGASPPVEHLCGVCASVFQTVQGLCSHLRATHVVKFTSNELACNPCGEWFATSEAAAAHHKQHKARNKPYPCRGCGVPYGSLPAHNQHVSEATWCVPWTEVPDVKCEKCWRLFPTRMLLAQHRCAGADARPGGKCSKCNKTYATLRSLKKHKSSCTSKKKGVAGEPAPGARVAPSTLRRLRPARVVTARCDELLAIRRGRCNVKALPEDFGLARHCVYPYRALVRVKQEPLTFDGMVSINKDVRDEFYIEEDYVHWDSDNSSSDEEFSLVNPMEKKKKVPSLTTLTLKTIYSKRCLGKVPRKLRKVRSDKFDSFYNPEAEFDNVQDDINNIIDNLGDDNVETETCGFSVSDIKLTDVKSISEVDNVSAGNNEVNGETNYESDSLLENQSEVAANDKVESIKIATNETILNIVNKHIMNPVLDDGSETDASIEDNAEPHGTKRIFDEKDTASENSLDIRHTVLENSPNRESLGTKQVFDEKSIAVENIANIESQGTKRDYDETGSTSGNNVNNESQGTTETHDEKDTASENSLDIRDTVLENSPNREPLGTKQVFNEKSIAVENIANIESQGTRKDYDETGITSGNNVNNESQGTTETHDEKDTASEESINIDTEILNNTKKFQNGNASEAKNIIENDYRVIENQTDLINELDELYDKKLMEELDAQIGDKSTSVSEKSDKIMLDDLVPHKNISLGLDNISDEEFNFDA